MDDLRIKIIEKYQIDIDEDNLLELYKIKDQNISSDDLKKSIEDTRNRWKKSLNGTNEKYIEIAKKRLAKSDKYEKILNDSKLRKALFKYYGNNGNKDLDFAKEYFGIIASSKKLNTDDVNFFFKCYKSQKKYKKEIIEMLKNDYKLKGMGKGGEKEENENEENKKSKKESKYIIKNKFDEKTILDFIKCEEIYQKASSDEAIYSKFPDIKKGLYYFLNLDGYKDVESFTKDIFEKKQSAFTYRQDKGDKFQIYVDIYNKVYDIIQKNDIKDNFEEYKLLVRYTNLIPYMYAINEMKKNTYDMLVNIAKREYFFTDASDFAIRYFKIIYDNFNIDISAIENIINKAKKSTAKSFIIKFVDNILGRNNEKRVPFIVNVIHFLIYWPIFSLYFVFEIFKTVCINVKKLVIPVGIISFVYFNIQIPKIYKNVQNMLILTKIGNHKQWYEFVETFSRMKIETKSDVIIESIIAVILLLLLYGIPTFIVTDFIFESAVMLKVNTDWVGIERTFNVLCKKIKENTINKYSLYKDKYVKKEIKKVFINFICILVVILLISLI